PLPPAPNPPLFPYTTLFRSNAARSSQCFEPFDNARLEYVSRALQLFFRRAIGAECLEFRVDGFFEVFRLHSRARGRLHLKLRKRDRKSTRLNSSHVAISYAV